ncbi:chloride channel protein [Actinomyces sp. zg296]|uniref:chloride channel protein n=1 Tax=Actinomyces sp. zg296 TaxID=2609289 RepID=UPI00191578D5
MVPACTPPLEPARRPALPAAARLLCALVLSGVAAGLIGIAMAYLLEGFEWLFYGVEEGSLPERVAAAPAWRRIAAPALGGALAGALWWWERSTGGVVSVERVVADSGAPGPDSPSRRMGVLRPFGDAVLQVLTVGAGNSVGREGAPRLAAGAVAVVVGRKLGLDRSWARLLVASAAGAGLAAMYNAPLGGAAYAVEIVMLTGMRRRGALLAVPLSALATVVSWWGSGGRASLVMPAAPLTAQTLLACLLAAPVAALLGWLAARTWAWCKARRLPDSWSLPLAIGGAGLATGAASLLLPELPGNGRDAFQGALDSPAAAGALAALLGVVVLKPLLTGATLGAGATGGLLAPSFALGASGGAAIAVGLSLAGMSPSIPAAALMGAGVALAVTQRAPVFGAVFVWEVTQGPIWILPPLLVACWAACRITRPHAS